MPSKPLTHCPEPGCTQRTTGSRCADHRRAADSVRPDRHTRGYTNDWNCRARAFLAHHPQCERCGAPSTDAHHAPKRTDLIDAHVDDPDADHWLHALCASCHSHETNAGR